MNDSNQRSSTTYSLGEAQGSLAMRAVWTQPFSLPGVSTSLGFLPPWIWEPLGVPQRCALHIISRFLGLRNEPQIQKHIMKACHWICALLDRRCCMQHLLPESVSHPELHWCYDLSPFCNPPPPPPLLLFSAPRLTMLPLAMVLAPVLGKSLSSLKLVIYIYLPIYPP